MKYLVDTDVLIDHLRGKKKLDPTLLKDGVGISIITYGELLYGA
ncbi:Ribonuclease VapC10 (fragment) [Candidatus Roizmanbacteria bacterium]